MDEHDLDRCGQHGEAAADRRGAGRAALDDAQVGAGVRAVERRGDLVDQPGRRCHHHQVDPTGGQGADRVGQHRPPAERQEGLRLAAAEAFAAAGRRDHGGDDRAAHVVVTGGHSGSATGFANTIRPFAVVSTLVTRSATSPPIPSRDRSATTIVPSSR